jgi:hypothetical protein
MVKKVISINDCRFVYGFWLYDVPGSKQRAVQEKCCFEMPVVKNKQTKVGLKLLATDKTRVNIIVNDKKVVAVNPGPEWNIYYFTIKSAKNTVFVRLEHPLFKVVKWAHRDLVLISDIEIDCPAGDEKDLVFNPHERIESVPLKLGWTKTWLEHYKRNNYVDSPAFKDSDTYNVYFGDLHIHSNNSACGHPHNGTIDENYKFAMDETKLDFCAITDHEYQTEQAWKEYCDKVDQYYKPGKFATLLAFEWTSEFYGHRNVYYKKNHNPLFNWWETRTDSPAKLWKQLQSLKTDVFAVPHHPPRLEHLVNWDSHVPEMEPLVEIFSQWGNHEYYGAPIQETEKTLPGLFVQDALTRQYKLGFVGGSDGHFSKGGVSGLTAVLAKSLTREDVFDAFVARRVYATTGAKIKLDFTLNGFPMGSILKVDQYSVNNLFPIKLSVAISGTNIIDKIEIIQNGQVIYNHSNWKEFGKDNGCTFNVPLNKDFSSECANHLANFSRYYYVRVTQVDKHMAWSSPIWIDFKFN